VHPQSQDLSSRNTDTDRLLKASAVAHRFGISKRTLDRWLLEPHRAFPPPAMFTNDCSGRVSNRFWRLSDLLKWERAVATRDAQAG
jgi:predicted DNA-binding transcriptional regulator AlpA